MIGSKGSLSGEISNSIYWLFGTSNGKAVDYIKNVKQTTIPKLDVKMDACVLDFNFALISIRYNYFVGNKATSGMPAQGDIKSGRIVI